MSKLDFKLTKNGDLGLAAPKVDDNGNILYRQSDGTVSTLNTKGSVMIQDLGLVRGKRSIQQVIYSRLKTDNPEWYHHKKIGGDLSDLIGEPNTRETANMGVVHITSSLLYGGFLNESEFIIRPVPISANEILFLLTIMLENEQEFRLPLVFDLHRGLKEVTLDEEN